MDHITDTVELPAPLTGPDCDLQDFKFMPLDVGRLRDSDLASDETPEACWAAVLLWCASWHQVPAASIPDNDQWLAKQAGYVSRGRIDPTWPKVKEGALRGWIKCADGRLYHPVVAEKAREAWRSKLEQRWRSECGRVKKHNQRHGTTLAVPDLEWWLSHGCPQGHPLPVPEDNTQASPKTGQACPQLVLGETPSKRQREGQGQGQGLDKEPNGSSSPAKLPPCPTTALIDLYHELLPELPACKVQSDGRIRAIGKAWKWALTSKKPDQTRRAETAEQALEWFRNYFERTRDNDFLMGRTPRTGEHANWKCDLDFLLTERGMKHVIEKTQTGDTN